MYIHIYIYIYFNFKAINNVLDAKIVLKTHLLIKIFRLLYIYIHIYIYHTYIYKQHMYRARDNPIFTDNPTST